LAPTIVDTSKVPTPAPFPYPESSTSLSAARDRDSRTARSHPRQLTAKAVREAILKYNGVPKFCGFLAALPGDVFDSKLGKTRPLLKGSRVVRKNVALAP